MHTTYTGEDIGLSGLAGRFHMDWTLNGTARHVVELNIEDRREALLILDDTVRVLRSPLPDEAVTAMWRAGTGTYQDLDRKRRGVDVRQWLNEVADVCAERLRQDDPACTVAASDPAPAEFAGAVLDEIEQAGPALHAATAESTYRSVPGVLPALRAAVAHLGPDLGFRFFLRIMFEYMVTISREQYERYRDLGEHLGCGCFWLDRLAILTEV